MCHESYESCDMRCDSWSEIQHCSRSRFMIKPAVCMQYVSGVCSLDLDWLSSDFETQSTCLCLVTVSIAVVYRLQSGQGQGWLATVSLGMRFSLCSRWRNAKTLAIQAWLLSWEAWCKIWLVPSQKQDRRSLLLSCLKLRPARFMVFDPRRALTILKDQRLQLRCILLLLFLNPLNGTCIGFSNNKHGRLGSARTPQSVHWWYSLQPTVLYSALCLSILKCWEIFLPTQTHCATWRVTRLVCLFLFNAVDKE